MCYWSRASAYGKERGISDCGHGRASIAESTRWSQVARQAVMALILLILAGQMIDYTAKVSLLVLLGLGPGYRVSFVVLSTIHIASNLHSAFAYSRQLGVVSRRATPVIALLLGVATPLLQVAHCCDALAAWWKSQELWVGRPRGRTLLDMVFEGLAFIVVAFRLIQEEGVEPPSGVSASHFAVILAVAYASSLVMVAMGFVFWDSALSLQLSKELYKRPRGVEQIAGVGNIQGIRSLWRFVFQLSFRGSEVAGRVALLTWSSLLLGTGPVAAYSAMCFIGNIVILVLSASERETFENSWRATTIVSAPLLFADLPQFVDSPKHLSAAQAAAQLLCACRAVEFALALGVVVAGVLLEKHVDILSPSSQTAGTGLPPIVEGGAVLIISAWRILCQKKSIQWWLCCLLAHYVCLAACHCQSTPMLRPGSSSPPPVAVSVSVTASPATLVRSPLPLRGPGVAGVVAAGGSCGPASPLGAAGFTVLGLRHSGTTTPSARMSPSSSSAMLSSAAAAPMPRMAVAPVSEEKDFWPAACGLATLLLATSCDCAPPVWPSSGCQSGWPKFGGRLPVMEDFDTVRLIGYGEFGKVFLVRHRATFEQFAMKRLSREFYSRRRMTDKARREIETLRTVGPHPFVVQLVCVVETVREWAVVMEYCPRGDLQQFLLAEGSPGLPLDQTMRLAAEICCALEHLHTNGVVFRDLKLENVVLDSSGHAKITDFGLAKQHAGGRDAIAEATLAGGIYSSFTRTFCGSYGYAAPEVNPRRQVHGFAADLYSFGVLLLMLLMGGKVYHDGSREPPCERRLPPETPEDLRAILGALTFDFYWASHHLLKAARATHRVEVNINGAVSIASRGPLGVRRQPRPRRPPTSPRELDPEGRWAPQSNQPHRFPHSAVVDCESVRRRWDLGIDLVRCLTEEMPERRGTVANIKQHPFFVEWIPNWWMIYPKKWLVQRLEEQLRRRFDGGSSTYPKEGIAYRLERLHISDLAMLQDNESAQANFLDGQLQETSRTLSPFMLSALGATPGHQAVWHTAPSLSPMTPMTMATTPVHGAGSPGSPRHSWASHYTP